jgi:hypothetical protein
MFSIFYDLETSDKNWVGQILNYSFILVDDNLQPVDELSGLIRISRLQIPDAGAILANRTDVLAHQRAASDDEYAAMHKIDAFIRRCIEKSKGALCFVGFNSARFDLQYLRTSFIRNGLDPYYGKSLHYRDLLHVVQKAYISDPSFQELIRKQRGGEKKLSLALQTVAHAFGLLEGVQAHESREDVLLTVRVAERLKSAYGIDVCAYQSYEAFNLHSTLRSGAVYLSLSPEYDLTSDRSVVRTPITLLDTDHRSALWVNLDRYMADPHAPGAIMYRATGRSPLYVSPQAVRDVELERAARAALTQYKSVSIRTFFDRSTCDIEQDIYRLDGNDRTLLSEAIRTGSKACLERCSSDDAKKLWVRFQLGRMPDVVGDARAFNMLSKYAHYRYGGKLQLAKTIKDDERSKGGDERFHATLEQMVLDLIQRREGAVALGNKEDEHLLNALESYYRQSDIVQVAGSELVPMWGVAGRRA